MYSKEHLLVSAIYVVDNVFFFSIQCVHFDFNHGSLKYLFTVTVKRSPKQQKINTTYFFLFKIKIFKRFSNLISINRMFVCTSVFISPFMHTSSYNPFRVHPLQNGNVHQFLFNWRTKYENKFNNCMGKKLNKLATILCT